MSSTGQFNFTCPHCSKKYTVPSAYAGKVVSCGCGQKVKAVPAGATAPEQPFHMSTSSASPVASDAGLVSLQNQVIESLQGISAILMEVAARLESRGPGASGGSGAMQYKVLTQKDKWFSGKFDPEKLEGAINSYASQGWRVRGVATASFPGFGGNRDEMVVVMERDA